jgi:sulfur relay (sulfurtransferase) complex TusBCD TusD component (DsrE family)
MFPAQSLVAMCTCSISLEYALTKAFIAASKSSKSLFFYQGATGAGLRRVKPSIWSKVYLLEVSVYLQHNGALDSSEFARHASYCHEVREKF